MRKYTKFFMLILSLVLFFGLVACDKKVEISFVNPNETLEVGKTLQLDFTISDDKLSLEWSTDNSAIIEVDQTGLVKGLKAGDANVTVKVKDKDVSATIKVTVYASDPTSVVITDSPTSAKAGTIVQLKANVLPATAIQEVTWSSNNTDVATVDATGKVEFKKAGEVVITAATKAKATVKRDVTITVGNPDPNEIVVAAQTGVNTVMLYDKLQMVATVNPEDAPNTVTWSVNDDTIASIDANGLLDAKKVGKVIVTATSTVKSEVLGTLEIEVTIPAATSLDVTGLHTVIQVDEELQLTSKILPDLASQAVTYTSSSDAIATVDATGKVKGIATGEATITVKAVSNETLTKTYAVKVVAKVEAPTHTKFLVDGSLKDSERYSKVTVNEVEYILGVNAFSDLANFALSDGSEIYIKKGTYLGSLLVNKNNVLIYSDNKDNNPNTTAFNFDNQAVIKGKITIADAQDGLTINGLSFTENGKVEAKATAKNFSFLNNNVFDTVEATKAWGAARDYTLTGVVTLWKQGKAVENLAFENNRFNNVSETNIIVGNTKGLLIKNNTFTNFDRDAIRIDGGSNYLSTIIDGNRFVNEVQGGYNGVYFRTIGVYYPEGEEVKAEEKNIVEVKNNYFENIGKTDVMSGALSTNGYQEFGAEVNIHHNTFKNCLNYIQLRNNATAERHTANAWVGNINYNIFLGVPATYYHRNLNGGNDTETTNPTLVNMDYNFFGDLEGNPVDLTSDDIKAKFQSVKSLEYSYTSIDAMTALFVNGEWSEKVENDEIIYDGMKFVYGVNAFSTIADALEAVAANGMIIVLPGTYDESIEITKAVQLRTLNSKLNPTVDDAPFKADSLTATTITNVWYLNNVSDVSIKGFSFTGAARVRQYGATNNDGTTNFLYENNYAYDTSAATIPWQQAEYAAYGIEAKEDTTMPGFLSLAQNGTWMRNTKIMNNKFVNVSDTNIVLISAEGATITGNQFSNGDRDAIRLDHGSLNGTFNIKDNVFDTFKYNGIYVRSYTYALGGITFNIERNTFKNIGEASLTETAESVKLGAIATSDYAEKNDATFNIRFNNFENNYNYISLRAYVTDVTAWETKNITWKAIVEYNSFIDSDTVEFYFKNLSNASDTEQTNVDNAIFDKNFYGTDANTKAEITAAQFDHFKAVESNSTVYNTLADLEVAIAEYIEFIKPIIVDPALAEAVAGAKVVYDGVELEVGKSAFATIKEAAAQAVAGKTIKVLAGYYTEDLIEIKVDNLTVLGPNASINPITGTRKAEAVLKAKVLIGEDVKNTVINGFSLDYVAGSSLVTGHENGGIDGLKFLYNIINGASGSGAESPILFKQATADAKNMNFTINYNYIKNVGSDRGIRLSYIENLTIIGNKLENCSSDAIRLNDNGGSVTGKFVLENNTIINAGQFALFTGATTIKEMIIKGNTFEKSGHGYSAGAISIRELTTHVDGTVVTIENNTFKNSANYDIRIDHKAEEATNLVITIANNNFYTPTATIYYNNTTGIAKTLFKLNNKVYGVDDVETALAGLFEGETPRIKNANLEVAQ